MSASLEQIVGDSRRRTPDEKLAIVTAAFGPGGSVALAAKQHGVSAASIYIWRRQMRDGAVVGIPLPLEAPVQFAPVSIAPHANRCGEALVPDHAVQTCRKSAIEIRLGNGRILKVDESIEPTSLARLLAVLDAHGPR